MFIIKIKAVSSINNWPPMSTRKIPQDVLHLKMSLMIENSPLN